MEPDIGALGDEDHGRHPIHVRAEAFILDVGDGEGGHIGMAAHFKLVALTALVAALGMKAHPDRRFFLFEYIYGKQKAAKIVAEKLSPVLAKKRKLAVERVWCGQQRCLEQVEQA